MNIDEFSQEVEKLQSTYKTNLTPDQVVAWYEDFKDLSLDNFKRAIDKTIATSKTMPTIAEVRGNISTRKMNLNSSYFYANFKDIRPYFDIITGEPLEPFN